MNTGNIQQKKNQIRITSSAQQTISKTQLQVKP